ncbi:MAG: hypothetical protein AAF682_29495 [Planctomycetota bacterium]
MAHTIEPAASGRAKCRGCGTPIQKGELRLGERLPNPFADEGDMTLWFHLVCGAYKRPEPLLEALESAEEQPDRKEWLVERAKESLAHRRLPRIDGGQRDPSGRATCRSCKDKIEKGAWRIRLTFYEEGRFNPSGFVHARCATEYLGTADVVERVRCFSGELGAEDEAELRDALGTG